MTKEDIFKCFVCGRVLFNENQFDEEMITDHIANEIRYACYKHDIPEELEKDESI